MTELDSLVSARATLEQAKAAEKKGRRLRREGDAPAALAAFETARELYADSNLAWNAFDDILAYDVKRAIERCTRTASNLRRPKEQRAAAVTSRPLCLACDKPLRRFKFDGLVFNDGTPREWGDKGDNRFCGLTCGHLWACRNAPLPKGAR